MMGSWSCFVIIRLLGFLFFVMKRLLLVLLVVCLMPLQVAAAAFPVQGGAGSSHPEATAIWTMSAELAAGEEQRYPVDEADDIATGVHGDEHCLHSLSVWMPPIRTLTATRFAEPLLPPPFLPRAGRPPRA